MRRYLYKALQSHLGQKIILLSGPRQVGKTYFSKHLDIPFAYYNFDSKGDRAVFKNQSWDEEKKLLIFDELHKMKKWKLWLKGLYDEGRFSKQAVLVTGSARLETMKKVGDSLAGRQLAFRLHPLDLKELAEHGSAEQNYKKLIERGGFPEPFLAKDPNFHRLWRRNHLDIILRQDLFTLELTRDIQTLELLVDLLAQRVGSPISVKALSEDLQVSDKTVTRWLSVLEDLYIIFKISPYSKNIPRGLLKASKYYFFDLGRIEGDESAKLENLVALSLRKELDFLEDTKGLRTQLHYLRTKDHKEIDFYVSIEKSDPLLIEVKLSDPTPSPSFALFNKWIPKARKLQWVLNLKRNFNSKDGVRVESVVEALAALDLRPN